MKVSICTDEDKLIRYLKNQSLKSPSIISIDGVDGVGKSSLACKFLKELGFAHIEIDTFVQEEQGGYLDYIDYTQLAVIIRQTLTEKQGITLEGICVQQVLKQLHQKSNVKVYIKVIDKYGFWMDQIRLFPPDKSADEIIAERRKKGFSLGHVEDIIRYHYTFKPHEDVDYILERQKT